MCVFVDVYMWMYFVHIPDGMCVIYFFHYFVHISMLSSGDSFVFDDSDEDKVNSCKTDALSVAC